MTTRLHIIASCTDRKAAAAGEPVRLRDVWPATAEVRARTWCRLLQQNQPSCSIKASDLYLGGHWAVIRELPELSVSLRFRPSLWVASAGYGLVASEELVRAYSATFSARQPDSVALGCSGAEARSYHQRWWRELATVRAQASNEARSLTGLAEAEPRATLLVVASPSYIAAMAKDLVAARELLADQGQLVIVSSGTGPVLTELAPNWIRTDARMLHHLANGNRISLNALIAHKMLNEAKQWPIRADVLQERYKAMLEELPPNKTYDRQPQSDAQVKAFIRAALHDTPNMARTPMLRRLRDSGHRCEQQRFKLLYQEVVQHGA